DRGGGAEEGPGEARALEKAPPQPGDPGTPARPRRRRPAQPRRGRRPGRPAAVPAVTVSALTRPGERDRLVVKFGEIDWIFCLAITLIAGAGAVMLFSIAGSKWMPWAAPHLARYAFFFAIMIVLSIVDLRVWFALAYPIYGVAFLLLIAVDLVGRHALGAQRWLQAGPIQIQPSEIMKIGLVLALARFYHGLS